MAGYHSADASCSSRTEVETSGMMTLLARTQGERSCRAGRMEGEASADCAGAAASGAKPWDYRRRPARAISENRARLISISGRHERLRSVKGAGGPTVGVVGILFTLAIALLWAETAHSIRVGPSVTPVAILSAPRRPGFPLVDSEVELVRRRILLEVDDMDAEKEEELGGFHRTIGAAAMRIINDGDGALGDEEDEMYLADSDQWIQTWINRKLSMGQ
ncbi:hypothetical protein CBR_g16838 [Chara braunii]|uniref:Uncharacterized protein n=1 Tax=Chara braunii TaxID=69332 RepID=A0A388KTV6_CHABU|nr:hypothetical protein CBR_g16838 [Chara braunii]|eukprot:GBG73495.1 hypothetical protein CBR_g16838 [Chara braunii]